MQKIIYKIINKIFMNEVESELLDLIDAKPNVKNYLNEILKKENIRYFQLALDNTNMQKNFTINRYFEPSGSSLNSAHKKDPLYNLSRKAFMKIFQPFKKIEDYEEISVQTQ